MKWLLDKFLGSKLGRETDRYLAHLAQAPILATRRNSSELLARLRAEPGSHLAIGNTPWGDPVILAVSEIIAGHSLVTGATNAGKTTFCLIIFEELLKWT